MTRLFSCVAPSDDVLLCCVSHSQKRLIREMALESGVLVTSYSHVVTQLDTLLQYDWQYVVLDEGHKIRNPDAQVTLAVKQVRSQ